MTRAHVDSPISRAGYWYGDRGRVRLGLPLEHRAASSSGTGSCVFRACRSGRSAAAGPASAAATSPTTTSATSVLDHEVVHKRAVAALRDALPAALPLAGRDPLKNRFEIEAGLETGGYLATPRRGRASSTP